MDVINFIRELPYQVYFGCFISVLASMCFYFLKSKDKTSKKIIWLFYILVFTYAFFIFIKVVIHRIYNPEVWDFTAFYLYGKVGSLGYNFYSPENFHIVSSSLNLPVLINTEFVEDIVNVGFLYPPPTIFLFTPLGFLSYDTALICWTLFNLFFSLGCIYFIYDLFFRQYKLKGLILVAILFFVLSPVLSTISFSQTNFILLFLLLLMKKYSDKKFAGILFALALFTKPYMIIFGLYFILRKQWKTLIYFLVSSLIIVGLTVLTFGKGVFISYIFNNPSRRLPNRVFSESANQSLQAVLLRFNLISIDTPIYLYISIGVFLLTAFYLFYLLKRKLYDFIWVILLLVCLMLYPGTLTHYGVLLLFIIFQFFDEKKQLGFNIYLNILIIGIFYYLSSVSVFTCICFLLIITLLKSMKPFFPNNLNINTRPNIGGM